MGYRANIQSGDASKHFLDKVYGIFTKSKQALSDKSTKLVLHVGADFRQHSTNAFTAGGRVNLMIKSSNCPSGFSLNETTSDKYFFFLCIHEIGHNKWAPESIIPHIAAIHLTKDVLGKSISGNPSALIDIITNAHICFNAEIERITGFKGYDLVSEKFRFESGTNLERRAYSKNSFVDWHTYFVKKAMGQTVSYPSRNSELIEAIEKLISNKRPCIEWIGNFYRYYTQALYSYEDVW